VEVATLFLETNCGKTKTMLVWITGFSCKFTDFNHQIPALTISLAVEKSHDKWYILLLINFINNCKIVWVILKFRNNGYMHDNEKKTYKNGFSKYTFFHLLPRLHAILVNSIRLVFFKWFCWNADIGLVTFVTTRQSFRTKLILESKL